MAAKRLKGIQNLIAWSAPHGVVSRDSVRFLIDDNGQVKCIANHFIPANKHILHVPFKLDFSFPALKLEVHPDKAWNGWNELRTMISNFEEKFEWNPYNYEQKDYFSKNMLLLICIVGLLHKLSEEPDLEQHSEIVQAFYYYWHALPLEVGCVFNWSDDELACLQGSSFAACLPDARRLGQEIYHSVFIPFIKIYAGLFGGRAPMSLDRFLYVNSVILTRSFATKKDRIALLPLIDLVNGKPNELHNTTLENCSIQSNVNGEFHKFHILETSMDIYAGDEVFIEYAQVGNGDYLMTYNYLPLDPEVIMNNQKTDIFLDLTEFLETELLRMHANHPPIRSLKRQHVYGFFNLPKVIPMSMEDLFSTDYSCMPSIRQVLIFLQFNESDAMKAIKTSRIKSQLNPHQLHHLFHMFLKFIDVSIERVNLPLIRSALGNTVGVNVINNPTRALPLTANMRSAIYLQMSERLVVEVMINRFINLFPESFHELGYSILRAHLISSEINSILEELCRPVIAARQSQCLVCGSFQGVSKCSRCRRAFYCSAGCQKEHWQYHKKICRPTATPQALTTVPPCTSCNAAAAASAPSAPAAAVAAVLASGMVNGVVSGVMMLGPNGVPMAIPGSAQGHGGKDKDKGGSVA